MLMADMTESERETVRDLNKFWLPEGAELLELVDVLWNPAVALIRMPDGTVNLTMLGDDDPDDVPGMLEERIAPTSERWPTRGASLGSFVQRCRRTAVNSG